MKQTLTQIRKGIVPLLFFFGSTVLLTSCLKNKNEEHVDVPSAGLMAFNLAPEQQGLAVRLNGNHLTPSSIGYTGYNGGYQNIYVGNRTVESYGWPAGTPLATTNFDAKENEYYTLFFVGFNNQYRNIIATDGLDSLPVVEKAYVRYVNAITDTINAANVSMTAAGSSVVNEAANFGKVSAFTEVNPGDLTISVKSSNGVDTSRTIPVAAKKVYTVLLIGMPNATNDLQKVQIRFIENGTLTNSTTNQ